MADAGGEIQPIRTERNEQERGARHRRILNGQRVSLLKPQSPKKQPKLTRIWGFRLLLYSILH